MFFDIFIVWPEFAGLLFVPGVVLLDDLPAPVAEFPRSPVLLFEFALKSRSSHRKTPDYRDLITNVALLVKDRVGAG